jgi:hypothetical protein
MTILKAPAGTLTDDVVELRLFLAPRRDVEAGLCRGL